MLSNVRELNSDDWNQLPPFSENVVFPRVEKIFAQPARADDDEMNKFGKHWKTANDLISPSAIRMIGCVSWEFRIRTHGLKYAIFRWKLRRHTSQPLHPCRRRIRMSEINQINSPTSTPLQKSSWRHENVGKILKQQRKRRKIEVRTHERALKHWSGGGNELNRSIFLW